MEELMVDSVNVWARRPNALLRAALVSIVLAVLFLAPIYLQHQWPAAQVATAPWWIALVRMPFFAGIMMFTYYPAYWVLLYALWVLSTALVVFAFIRWRKSRSRKADLRTPDRAAAAAR
jgi:hypothetical protein